MRSDVVEAFRCFQNLLEFCRFFEVSGHRRACPDLAMTMAMADKPKRFRNDVFILLNDVHDRQIMLDLT